METFTGVTTPQPGTIAPSVGADQRCLPAQAGLERDLDPLPIQTLFAVAEAMPAQYRLVVLLGMRSGEVRASSAETSMSPAMFRR